MCPGFEKGKIGSEMPNRQENPPEQLQLSRQLGLFDSTMVMVGIVIGSGIFLTTGIMAKSIPSAGLILLAGTSILAGRAPVLLFGTFLAATHRALGMAMLRDGRSRQSRQARRTR